MARDVIIRGGHVLTMDPESGDLAHADVLISDGRIAGIGSGLSAGSAEIIDARGAIVAPGLVDGHRHVWQSLLRGVASDWTLPEYMLQARSLYSMCFDPDAAFLASLLGGLESINAGITTVVDHSHLQISPEFSAALVRGLLASRVGGVFCYALQNVPTPRTGCRLEPEPIRDAITRLPDEWHDAAAAALRDEFFSTEGRLRFGIALPEAAPYLPAALATALLDRAVALDPFLLTAHWDAGRGDSVTRELADSGRWPQRTSLTHCNHLGEDELRALAAVDVGICTTPDIESGMGTGPLIARHYVDIGGQASLGTDLGSYARADILQQARLLLQAARSEQARVAGVLPHEISWRSMDALQLATLGGARALGLDDEIGSLTVGKRGDAIVVRPDLAIEPVGDPASTLVFGTAPSDISEVIIEGEVVKRDGKMLNVDLAAVGQRASQAARRVIERHDALPREMFQEVWAGMFG